MIREILLTIMMDEDLRMNEISRLLQLVLVIGGFSFANDTDITNAKKKVIANREHILKQ